jgi:RHS repeat-associated protein
VGKVRQAGALPTDYGFTGQLADDTGLILMGARYYDPYLIRWIQPDSIVPQPGNPQTLNR